MNRFVCPNKPAAQIVRLLAPLAIATGIIAAIVVPAAAQDRSVPFRSRSVDLVLLNDGTRLLGSVLPTDDTRMLLRAEWLTANATDLMNDELKEQIDRHHQEIDNALAVAVEKEIARLREESPDDLRRIGLLSETLTQLKPDEPVVSPWVVLVIPEHRLRRIQTQSDRIRPIGFFGVLNEIESVEDRRWQDVAQALQQIPTASQRGAIPQPANSEDAPNQLAQLLAAIDLRTGKSAGWIQAGESFIAEGDNVGMEALLAEMLTEGFRNQLSQLLEGRFPDDPQAAGPGGAATDIETLPDNVRQRAEQDDVQTVQISTFDLNPAAGSAAVGRVVFTRHGSGEWRRLFAVQAAGGPEDVSDDDVEELMQDPRIQQVATIFAGLGSDAADLKKALGIGAVVRVASSRCEDALQTRLADILNGRMSEGQLAPPPIVRLAAESD